MNIGILWDIENVTPPANANYIQAVIETVCKEGRLSYAMAFGNWNNNSIKNIAPELYSNNFELIHIPRTSQKNSTDMSLVAHGVELIFHYPHINRFVLVSGDGDFRPLLLSFKKHGKETWVICDVNKNASEELIKMADYFKDYRDIIKNMEDFSTGGENDLYETMEKELTKEEAFILFKEAVGKYKEDKKDPLISDVKIKIKLLNDKFDETKLGYSNWYGFVEDAIKETNITYENGLLIINDKKESTIPIMFQELIETLRNNDDWILFTQIREKINFENYGYKKFKDFALDAEKRGYIKIKNEGLIWSMKKSN